VIPHWERCAPWLAKALEHAKEHTLEHVRACLLDGSAILWPGERSAIVTQVVGGDLHFWLGGGNLRELMAMRPGIEAWGRAAGCRAATGKGRPGWERLMKRHGYAPHEGELRKLL